MSRYALHSRRNAVATGPALPRVDSPLSELSVESLPVVRRTKLPAEFSTASAQDSVPGPAASRVPASGKATLRNPPRTHVEVEEENSSPSDSEDDEDVGPQRNRTATGISKNLSRSNVEDANESDTSSSSRTFSGDQAESENETHHGDDFTTVRKSSKPTKASGKSTALRTKKMIGKTSRYDVLEVEETSDEDLDDPEPGVKHQKKHILTIVGRRGREWWKEG
ncbi:hypothetical protein IW261DRAFT_1557553 [Armillaria novae-zelandiae]|uniref:Uncharacterized protein n=1 Tax=Armillaria novae-zelandiae TaxID=153914 RepID=A0AA39PRA9_9AGAR|nr:hypothetical protein IW261DRAFT_1557553 [Armillaria novae-zelandiae]